MDDEITSNIFSTFQNFYNEHVILLYLGKKRN